MILVVDDNRSAAQALARILTRQGHQATALFDGPSACERLDHGDVSWVFSDLKMEPMDGMELLAYARALPQPPLFVLMTGFGSVDLAVQAMHEGARDFLTKPVSPSKVLELLQPKPTLAPPVSVSAGDSPLAVALSQQIAALSQVDSTVLFLGEPGSGRADLARSLHSHGELLTITRPDRYSGQLETARTLLLPSVDLLSSDQHLSLLRLLNQLPQGGGPRVLATATADWASRADRAPATQQLYYKLALLVVQVPPLRDRAQDLPALLRALLDRRAQELGRSAPSPSQAELEQLCAHSWPGNLRELQAVVERALVFGSFSRPEGPGSKSGPTLGGGFSLAQHIEDTERTLILRALEQCQGDRSKLSELLGVERNTLRYKLKKYGFLDRI